MQTLCVLIRLYIFSATIAFYATLTTYTSIAIESNVIFPIVVLNEGEG